VLVLGQQGAGELAFGGGGGGRGVLHAGDGSREHAAHVRVEDGVALPVRERGHGGGCVLADAGQGEQLRVIRGYVPAVALRYGRGCSVQA
jgi:hypothetical protein